MPPRRITESTGLQKLVPLVQFARMAREGALRDEPTMEQLAAFQISSPLGDIQVRGQVLSSSSNSTPMPNLQIFSSHLASEQSHDSPPRLRLHQPWTSMLVTPQNEPYIPCNILFHPPSTWTWQVHHGLMPYDSNMGHGQPTSISAPIDVQPASREIKMNSGSRHLLNKNVYNDVREQGEWLKMA